jgi:sucrose-6-phosphate hydrolase SacC (GH32 family)
MVGEFDGKRFTPATGRLPMNLGPDCYATQTWSDAPGGRRVAIAWLYNWAYKSRPDAGTIRSTMPTKPWTGGCLTVPFELSLRTVEGAPRLVQQPVAETDRLRGAAVVVKGVAVVPGGSNPLAAVRGKAFDIELHVRMSSGSCWSLRVPAGAERFYGVGYDARTGMLFADRRATAHPGIPSYPERYECPVAFPANGELRLRLLIDSCSVEVYAGEGLAVMSTLLLADPAADSLGFAVDCGSVDIAHMAIHTVNC